MSEANPSPEPATQHNSGLEDMRHRVPRGTKEAYARFKHALFVVAGAPVEYASEYMRSAITYGNELHLWIQHEMATVQNTFEVQCGLIQMAGDLNRAFSVIGQTAPPFIEMNSTLVKWEALVIRSNNVLRHALETNSISLAQAIEDADVLRQRANAVFEAAVRLHTQQQAHAIKPQQLADDNRAQQPAKVVKAQNPRDLQAQRDAALSLRQAQAFRQAQACEAQRFLAIQARHSQAVQARQFHAAKAVKDHALVAEEQTARVQIIEAWRAQQAQQSPPKHDQKLDFELQAPQAEVSTGPGAGTETQTQQPQHYRPAPVPEAEAHHSTPGAGTESQSRQPHRYRPASAPEADHSTPIAGTESQTRQPQQYRPASAPEVDHSTPGAGTESQTQQPQDIDDAETVTWTTAQRRRPHPPRQ